MDFAAVAGGNYFLKRRRRHRRLLLVSLSASVAGLVLILTVKNYLVYRLISHFLLNTGMIFLCFGWHGRRRFLEDWAVSYLLVVVMGGMLEWVQENGLLPRSFFLRFAAVSLTGYGILFYLMQRKETGNHIFPAVLKKDARCLAVQAYWDSGNRLRDPYTGRGVSILSRAKAETFFDPQKDLVRYVPYRSLGETDGLLPVTDVDVLILTDAKGEYRVEKIAIGIANEGLLEDKGYDLILHASLL